MSFLSNSEIPFWSKKVCTPAIEKDPSISAVGAHIRRSSGRSLRQTAALWDGFFPKILRLCGGRVKSHFLCCDNARLLNCTYVDDMRIWIRY
ncbi:hypothetical protein J6590_104415 [Homalodisca vitripennis]|nr:hypothetical protein J6590_104415 [Homalodisca vitripennis]